MVHRASWSWDFEGDPERFGRHAEGYARRTLLDRATGAVHTELGLCRLEPGGRVDAHVHSYERCVYVLGGRPVVELDGRLHQLGTGHFALFPIGVVHGWHNPGEEEARWLEVSTPQPAPAGGRVADTLFIGASEPAPGRGASSAPAAPDPGDPRTRWVGRYLGTPPQEEALRVEGPVRGRATAGMDTALLAYSGISVKMLVDGNFGADLLTMFMVDYEPGGAAQVHDHPFEEAYFFLEGEIEAEIEGRQETCRAGDVLFCGVGEDHGFFNSGSGRVRWIETQAPQPPRRHSYRWPAHWERLAEHLGAAQDL
jgi:quercetin dioxygenase-like cupin family protein